MLSRAHCLFSQTIGQHDADAFCLQQGWMSHEEAYLQWVMLMPRLTHLCFLL